MKLEQFLPKFKFTRSTLTQRFPVFQALYAGSVECRCNDGFFRAQTDPRTAACTRAPSAPRNLTRRFLDPNTLMLTWDPPLDEGGRSDTQYKVECDVCSSLVTLSPASPSSQSSVTLSHLQPGSTYTIRVFAVNGVSNLSLDTDNYAEVSVSTGSGAPSVVSNLMISDKKPHQVEQKFSLCAQLNCCLRPSAKDQGITRVVVVLFHLSQFLFKRNLFEKNYSWLGIELGSLCSPAKHSMN